MPSGIIVAFCIIKIIASTEQQQNTTSKMNAELQGTVHQWCKKICIHLILWSFFSQDNFVTGTDFADSNKITRMRGHTTDEDEENEVQVDLAKKAKKRDKKICKCK